MKRIVSFIVPALNEERRIGRCLTSIVEQNLPPGFEGLEVIVVDNRSSDRTAELSRAQGAIVESVSPGHPSRARNAGVGRAAGEWLAFVDADCELPIHWLTTCGEHLLQADTVVAAAGTMSGPAANATWVERAWYEIGHRGGSATAVSVRWLPTFQSPRTPRCLRCSGWFRRVASNLRRLRSGISIWRIWEH